MTTQMINLYDISPPPMVDWIAHPDPKVGVVDNGVWRYKTDEEQHKEKMTDSLGYIKYDMEGAQDGEYVAAEEYNDYELEHGYIIDEETTGESWAYSFKTYEEAKKEFIMLIRDYDYDFVRLVIREMEGDDCVCSDPIECWNK